MVEILRTTGLAFWGSLGDMSPYLLFGFLVAGLLSVFISPAVVERHLGGSGFRQVFKASLFGVPLPLCSCGVIPVAASLRRHGASRGAVTSFLLSTPQTGVDSILATFSMLGLFIAIFRPVAAFLMGLLGGTLVNAFGSSRDEEDVKPVCDGACCTGDGRTGKLSQALKYGFVTLPRDIAKPLFAGLVIAGLITALVPAEFFARYIGTGIAGMLLMMVFGIPLYVCATASVPIAAALMLKGVSPGAALVFLVTGPATNAATIATLWKIMGPRTVLLYLATVAVGALAGGFALDGLIEAAGVTSHLHGAGLLGDFVKTLSALALLALLGAAIYRSWRPKAAAEVPEEPGLVSFAIGGMRCSHCATAIEKALGGCAGVDFANVDFAGGKAFVKGREVDIDRLKSAVTELGYTVEDEEDSPHKHEAGAG